MPDEIQLVLAHTTGAPHIGVVVFNVPRGTFDPDCFAINGSSSAGLSALPSGHTKSPAKSTFLISILAVPRGHSRPRDPSLCPSAAFRGERQATRYIVPSVRHRQPRDARLLKRCFRLLLSRSHALLLASHHGKQSNGPRPQTIHPKCSRSRVPPAKPSSINNGYMADNSVNRFWPETRPSSVHPRPRFTHSPRDSSSAVSRLLPVS